MARPASPEESACARIWAVDRGTSASQCPGSLPALRVACRYSLVGFDRQHILARPVGLEHIQARPVGPSSATTSTAGMTGPQNEAPIPPTTNPVMYEELTPEHQQKYDEVKAQFEAISSALSREPATTASGGRGSHQRALSTTLICLCHQRSEPEPYASR